MGQNKRRYQKDGFDLDLTYITDQCVAMSFPSEGRTAMFRNPMGEVARFFKTKHPGHYYVWNLCAERGYESHWFEQQCGRLLVDDHNVPKLKVTLPIRQTDILLVIYVNLSFYISLCSNCILINEISDQRDIVTGTWQLTSHYYL